MTKVPMSFRNILLFRIDKVGDLLLSTPLVRNIRDALPQARISLVVTPYNSGVLEGWDIIDNLIIYEPAWPAAKKWEFAGRLRKNAYDLCLVLSPVTEAHVLAYLTRAPTRAGIVYSRRIAMRLLAPRLLTHPLVLHIDEAIEKGDPIPHEVEQMLQLGALVGIPPVPRGLDVPVSEEDLEWARTILDGHGHRDTIIAFHLSSKWLTGGWTGAHLASLFERLLSEIPGSSLLVTYGPADADAVVRYGEGAEERGAPHDERIHLVGNLTFGKWAALFRRGSVVVTPDTGALHVAAAAGRPVVAVYEKKSFYHCSRQWAPWRIPARIIEKNKYEETADAIAGALRYLLEEQSRKGAND